MQSYFFLKYSLAVGLGLSFALFAQAQAADKPLDVIVQAVMVKTLQNDIEALGNLYAGESIVLTAKTTKTVSHINFVDGQRVSKGATLIEMMNAEETALMQEAGYHATDAKKQYARLKSLASSGAVSDVLLDQSQREYETARAHWVAVESRLKDLRITAPFSGVIGIRNISVGSLITPGQAIAILNDDSKMKLDFTVPAVYLRSLRIGLPITATSHDLGDKIFKGTVFSIDNQVDETTRSIKVRVLLTNPGYELKPGMLMSVVLHANLRKALVVSEAALVPMGSNNFVFLLQQKNLAKTAGGKQSSEKISSEKISSEKNSWIAEKRQIQIGQRFQGGVEILSGLEEGNKVVIHGLQKIQAGQVINILAEKNLDIDNKAENLSELLQQKQH